MKTSTLAITTSGVVVALITVGLTRAWASDVGQQPAQAGAGVPKIATTASALAEETTAVFELANNFKGQSLRPDTRVAATERIEKVLREPTKLEFAETALADAAEAIEETHGIRAVIDNAALEVEGLDPTVRVSFDLSGMSLLSGLNHTLRPLRLTWAIHDEALLITSEIAAQAMLTTKVYEVSDLVACQDKSGSYWADYDALIEVITTSTDPDFWDEVGGYSSITEAPFAGEEMLAISTIYETHQKIEQLLEQLRSIANKKGNGKLPVRQMPSGSAMMGFMGMTSPGEGAAGPANSE